MASFLHQKKSDGQMVVPELSIVVPVLDEVQQLPEFVADIQRQNNITYELIISDGGSRDGSRQWLSARDEIIIVDSSAGRGRQLNRGIAVARAEWVLLLHVDSRFDDELALRKGVDHLRRCGNRRVAGHFALLFRDTEGLSPAACDLYQRKARLGRAETVHGDQGFLLHRDMLIQIGCFREDLPVMEDTDYAERVRQQGQWQLLPAEISTSARRFAVEGLWQRQLLGALLMCFRTIGWVDFFAQAPAVYRKQSRTDRLDLLPFFELIHTLLATRPFKARLALWWATGTYVRDHGWQLFFAVDGLRAYRQGRSPGDTPMPCLSFAEPLYQMLTSHPVGRGITALLVRLWFGGMRLWLRRRKI